MEKDRKIFLEIIGVIFVISVLIVAFTIKERKTEVKSSDAYKFKEEYESLNNDKDFLSIEIDEDNIVKYITEEETIKKLENGSGVIYFGYPECELCRMMINTLLDTLKENSISQLYYLNILDIRDSYKLEKNKVLQEKSGSDGYYKIVELLDSYLEDYKLKNDSGKVYATGVKRLEAPTIVMVKNGQIVAFRDKVLESIDNISDNLTEEQKNELKEIYENMLSSYLGNVCTQQAC